MTHVSTETCDSCGKVRSVSTQDIYAGERGEPFWDLYFTSSDFPRKRDGELTYRRMSTGWDLCHPCVTKAREAVIAAVGQPNHDDWTDLPVDAELWMRDPK